jgi:hypothetical protein
MELLFVFEAKRDVRSLIGLLNRRPVSVLLKQVKSWQNAHAITEKMSLCYFQNTPIYVPIYLVEGSLLLLVSLRYVFASVLAPSDLCSRHLNPLACSYPTLSTPLSKAFVPCRTATHHQIALSDLLP